MFPTGPIRHDVENAPYNVQLLCKQITPEDCKNYSNIILERVGENKWICSDDLCEHEPPVWFSEFISQENRDNTYNIELIKNEYKSTAKNWGVSPFPFLCAHPGIWIITEAVYVHYTLSYFKMIDITSGKQTIISPTANIQSIKFNFNDCIIKYESEEE